MPQASGTNPPRVTSPLPPSPPPPPPPPTPPPQQSLSPRRVGGGGGGGFLDGFLFASLSSIARAGAPPRSPVTPQLDDAAAAASRHRPLFAPHGRRPRTRHDVCFGASSYRHVPSRVCLFRFFRISSARHTCVRKIIFQLYRIPYERLLK